MKKVKLLIDFANFKIGDVILLDEETAKAFVELGRGKVVRKDAKETDPTKRGHTRNNG